MDQKPKIATIKTRFDPGYIVLLDSGEEAQLRVLEQKGRELQYHLDGKEDQLYGEVVSVYVILRDDSVCEVSQFSPIERKKREENKQRIKIARSECEIGMKFDVQIVRELDWGCLCDVSNKSLSGAIKKPTKHLLVGESVQVIVVGKTSNGSPLFEIAEACNT